MVVLAREAEAIIYPAGDCGWCGYNCTRLNSEIACIDIAPPEGKICTEINGVCTIRSLEQPVITSYPTGVIYPTRVPTAYVTRATTPTRVPTPPAGCFYQQVQCVMAPCNPILVCATRMPLPSTGPTYRPVPTGTSNGDVDGDNQVTMADYAWWKMEYLTGRASRADLNRDGKVDLVDFVLFKKAYLLGR